MIDIASGEAEDRQPTPEEQGTDRAAIFVRIHKKLRTTPAMAAGVTERLWECERIGNLGNGRPKEGSMTWHTVLSGKEECRKNGAWDLTICQSKERALDQAHALLRYGYIVYAIQAGGKTIMDEQQIRKEFPLTHSK